MSLKVIDSKTVVKVVQPSRVFASGEMCRAHPPPPAGWEGVGRRDLTEELRLCYGPEHGFRETPTSFPAWDLKGGQKRRT